MKRLFGADGIRGLIDQYPLRLEDVERLGRVVSVLLWHISPNPIFLIGTDTRESCQRLKTALIEGLTHAGTQVLDAGIIPTAAVSFLIASKGYFTGGAIVSASHSPIVENGIKLFGPNGIKLSKKVEKEIEELFFSETILPFQPRPAPVTQVSSFIRDYAHAIAREFLEVDWRSKRVVVDLAHGAAFLTAPQVLEVLKIPYILINANTDGININHRAGSEFVRVAPRRFASRVQMYEAAVGFALDGDADRMVIVDPNGHLYDGDNMLAFLGYRLSQREQLNRKIVVATNMSNSGLGAFFQKHQLQIQLVENSDRSVTEELVKGDLNLGGEQIGHVIYHNDKNHLTGDGLRTALLVLSEFIRAKADRLSDLAPGMSKFPQIKASVHLNEVSRMPPDDIPGLSDLMQKIRESHPDLTHFECRPASTEPVYRIVMEARYTDVQTLAQKAFLLGQHILKYLASPNKLVEVLNCVEGGNIELI